MRKKLAIVISGLLVAAVLVLGGMHFAPSRSSESLLPGIFDTTGGAAASVGCAQWDVPVRSPEDYDGDAQDYAIEGDRTELLMIVVHQGSTYIISGKQCGVVLDWRRFPEKARPQDFKQ